MTTTTNNHLTLIEQVGGIEKAKAIVEGAPKWAKYWITKIGRASCRERV